MRCFSIRSTVVGICLTLGAAAGQAIDRSCDLAPYPSPQWTECEAANFAKQSAAPTEQLDLRFQTRLQLQSQSNLAAWTARALLDPSWLDARSGNTLVTPPSTSWGGPAAGDPFPYSHAIRTDGSPVSPLQARLPPVL